MKPSETYKENPLVYKTQNIFWLVALDLQRFKFADAKAAITTSVDSALALHFASFTLLPSKQPSMLPFQVPRSVTNVQSAALVPRPSVGLRLGKVVVVGSAPSSNVLQSVGLKPATALSPVAATLRRLIDKIA